MTDGDKRAYSGNHADAEDRHERIARRAQAATSQGFGAQARHHQGVGQHHQHVRQL